VPFLGIPFTLFFMVTDLLRSPQKKKLTIKMGHLLFFFPWLILFFTGAILGLAGGVSYWFVIFVKAIFLAYAGYLVGALRSIDISWIISMQVGAVLISYLLAPVYFILLMFISASSALTFADIQGIKGIGLGIFHLEGALILLILFIFYNLLSIQKWTAASSYMQLPIYFAVALALTLMARSALAVFLVYLIFTASLRKLLLISFALSAAMAFAVSLIYSGNGGYYLEPLEVMLTGNRSSSVSHFFDMFYLQESINFFGFGLFFDVDGGYYAHTDVGWLRLGYYGGWFLLGTFVFCLVSSLRNSWFLNGAILIYAISMAKGLYTPGIIFFAYFLDQSLVEKNET